ncbi:hypothetical protein [Arthrobacter sp.]|uniref:cyanobactin maturation protease PatG family protein n=1 Tax=Arthrobacter sp. TaxID=1667 RepID=UPI00339743EA
MNGQEGTLIVPDQLVYVLGQINYDFSSGSRRVSLQQRIEGALDLEQPTTLLDHLDEHPEDATAVQWVLHLEGVPIYVVEPSGPFASEAYALLRRFLREQLEEGVERVSIPGEVSGIARHRSGLELPVIAPVLRGMYSWTTKALVTSVLQAAGVENADAEHGRPAELRAGVTNFLERIYYELRNVGREPHERAVNFAATNAFEVGRIYEHAINDNMELDAIEVEPKTTCPPGANCWEVKLIFFYPERPNQTLRRLYRFTVDVADVVPATIGPMRSWSIR